MDTEALQLRQQIQQTRMRIDAEFRQIRQHFAHLVGVLIDRAVRLPGQPLQATTITSTTAMQQEGELHSSSLTPHHDPSVVSAAPPLERDGTPSSDPSSTGGKASVFESRRRPAPRQAASGEGSQPRAPKQGRRPSPWKFGGLGAKDLGQRLYHEILEDDCFGRAAQLAYYFLFALFPFFLFLTTLLAYIPVPNLLDQIMSVLAQLLPGEALQLVEGNLHQLVSGERGGLLSFGILAALWTSSSALTAIIESLNRAYDVEEGRPFWKVRGIAILLTVGLSAFIVVALVLLTFGPQLGRWIAELVGLGQIFEYGWNILRWPVIVGLLIAAMALLYYFAPDVEQQWQWITPGSAFAVIGWILTSLTFSFYVNNFGSYNATYGSIGAVIVLLTWMYVTGLFVLIGGELNAEIEHAAQDGKAPGKKELPSH